MAEKHILIADADVKAWLELGETLGDAARAKIAAGAKARWARIKGTKVAAAPKKRRTMSAAAKAKMAAAARARWAKAKAAGKSRL